jgi:alpha-tubulin suppressor-like RCC1 family protein
MFVGKRAAMVVAGAVALVGCDPKCIAEWLNSHGQGDQHGGDGDGDDHDPDPCPQPPTKAKAKKLAVGREGACAILENDGIKCWGSEDGWYRLGYGAPGGDRGDNPGEMGDALPLIPLGSGLTAAEVTIDYDVACAILSTGGVKCWGYNGYGAVLGAPIPTSTGQSVDTIPERTFSGGRHAVEIDSGAGYGYALLDDGSVARLGVDAPYPYNFGAGRHGVTFDVGSSYDDEHICEVLDTGEVACKGYYQHFMADVGQLGRPSSGDLEPMPAGGYPLVDLGTDVTATDVALGDQHTCALLDGGDVKCWGHNGFGQLGQDDTHNRGLVASDMGDALLPIQLGRPAIAITAGLYHSCAILDDGSVKCWGKNDEGQLGLGNTNNMGDAAGEMASLPSVDLGSGRTALAIDAGSSTCALLDDGTVKCWGGNVAGELGQGDTSARGGAAGQMGDALPVVDLGT